MLGNFTFHNPTKLHFGEDALNKLSEELKNYGKKVMLCYGGGSIKRNGIYDQVMTELKKVGCEVVELSGVMPNPTIEKVLEGAHLARREEVDFILGVGGGSTIDYCKAVAGSAWYDGDPWEYYFKNWQPMTCRWIPVGCVLTMAGTGSEMDSCSVISSHTENLKLFYNFRNPDFAILNPRFTFTVPKYQMVAGIYDIMSHILEQYLSGTDDNTSDYIAEGLMRSLIVSSRKALVNAEDYEARSNIMWTATWALNTLIDRGKATDWMVYAGTGCSCLYRCYPRTYACCCQRSLLPSAHQQVTGCRTEVQASGYECMACLSRRQDRRASGHGGLGDDGTMDARTGTGDEHHRLWSQA